MTLPAPETLEREKDKRMTDRRLLKHMAEIYETAHPACKGSLGLFLRRALKDFHASSA